MRAGVNTPRRLTRSQKAQYRVNAIYWGDLAKRLSLSETGSPAYTRTRLSQSSDLELLANTDCPGRLIPEMPQASSSDMATWSSLPYLAQIVLVKLTHTIY